MSTKDNMKKTDDIPGTSRPTPTKSSRPDIGKKTDDIGGSLGPTPTKSSRPDIGNKIEQFNPKDFPGRYVNEVPGIDPESIQRLTRSGMRSLATLASANADDVARILNITPVRAMSFIDRARRLLLKERNDKAGG